MKELEGRRILALEMNKEKDRLRFTTDRGPLYFEAWGDCCSRSWVENVSYFSELLRHEVERVEEIEQPKFDADDGYSTIRVMIYKIHTSAGDCLLEMRNESNGYYSGNIQSCGEPKGVEFLPVMGDL